MAVVGDMTQHIGCILATRFQCPDAPMHGIFAYVGSTTATGVGKCR